MNQRPVTILIDESPSFLSSSDHIYLSMSRETRTCTILGFQSIDGLVSEIRNEHQVRSLLSNVGTRFYLSNACPSTNEWSSQDAGEEWVVEVSASGKLDNDEVLHPFTLRRRPALPKMADVGATVSKQRRRVLPPEVFTQLQGGTRFNRHAEAWVRVMTPDGMRLYNVFFGIRLKKFGRKLFGSSSKTVVTLG